MSDEMLEVFKSHRMVQDKYAFFLLAAAAAALALSIQMTTGSPLTWSLVPLGLAVLSWACSFYFGCIHLTKTQAFLRVNVIGLLTSPNRAPRDTEQIRSKMEDHANAAGEAADRQFRLLILGAVLFIAWHLVEMGLRTEFAKPDAPTQQETTIESVPPVSQDTD